MKLEIITSYLNNSATDEDVTELLNWVEESEENKTTFSTMKNAWALAAMVDSNEDSNDHDKFQQLIKKINRKTYDTGKFKKLYRRILWNEFQRIAALILLAISLTTLLSYYLWHNTTVTAMNQFNVPCGQQAVLTLADGTKIWLNSQSTLTYPAIFSGSDREVILEGEAFFEVTHNEKKPFIVKTSQVKVKVLGTSFNVSSYPNDDNLSFTLVKGSISLLKATDSKEILQLKPGQLAIYGKSTSKLSVDTVDTELYTSWRNGQFKFKDLSFEVISKRLARNFNIKFLFVNQKLMTTKYSGSFHKYESLDQILRIMTTNSHFNYKIQKDTVIIR